MTPGQRSSGLAALHGEGGGDVGSGGGGVGSGRWDANPVVFLRPNLGTDHLGGGVMDGLVILRQPDDSGGEVRVGIEEVEEAIGEGAGLTTRFPKDRLLQKSVGVRVGEEAVRTSI